MTRNPLPDRRWYTPQNLPEFDLSPAAQPCWHPLAEQKRTETPTINPPGMVVDTRCEHCGTNLSSRWLPARMPDLT